VEGEHSASIKYFNSRFVRVAEDYFNGGKTHWESLNKKLKTAVSRGKVPISWCNAIVPPCQRKGGRVFKSEQRQNPGVVRLMERVRVLTTRKRASLDVRILPFIVCLQFRV